MGIKDFQLKFSVYQQKLQALDNELEPLKEAFCKLLVDQSIPLDDRWDLFCKAPSYMKNSEPWIHILIA